MITKPFKSYNGGKESDGTYQKIINIMPPHRIYVELFIGNGAIFRRKKPAEMLNIINDIDTSVIKKWNQITVKENVHIWNENAINILQSMTASTLNSFDTAWTSILDLFDTSSTLIYLDPPYIIELRKSQKKLYKHEFTIQDHTNLLMGAISIKKAKIIISGFPNKLYDEYLKTWNSFEFENSIRKGTQTEKIWFNFDYPTELHDYSYLGDNYRERERIKGIINRTVSKINKMPAVMRNYLFQELNILQNEKY
jgi:site-specific DNA-adenine methylase